jgi:hypothetical protein
VQHRAASVRIANVELVLPNGPGSGVDRWGVQGNGRDTIYRGSQRDAYGTQQCGITLGAA